jgi:hypothetical protein
MKKVLAKDCIVWTMFQNAKDPRWYQLEYCQKNCQYKCLDGKEYKKQSDIQYGKILTIRQEVF